VGVAKFKTQATIDAAAGHAVSVCEVNRKSGELQEQ